MKDVLQECLKIDRITLDKIFHIIEQKQKLGFVSTNVLIDWHFVAFWLVEEVDEESFIVLLWWARGEPPVAFIAIAQSCQDKWTQFLEELLSLSDASKIKVDDSLEELAFCDKLETRLCNRILAITKKALNLNETFVATNGSCNDLTLLRAILGFFSVVPGQVLHHQMVWKTFTRSPYCWLRDNPAALVLLWFSIIAFWMLFVIFEKEQFEHLVFFHLVLLIST